MRSPRLASLLFLALTLAAAPALAQSGTGGSGGLESPSGSSTDDESSGVRTVSATHSLDDDQATIEEDAHDEAAAAVPADDGINPRELPDRDYFFTGAFFRGLIIPGFIQEILVHYEGGTPVNFGGGAFFGWRRNGFNVRAEVWYMGFGNVGFYRGLNAADTELERVQSNLGVVFGSILFGWTFQVNEYFGIDLGFGLGIGGVTGNMWRQEAYRASGGAAAECTEPGVPSPGYCEGDGVAAEDRHAIHSASGPTYQRFCAANPMAPECAASPGAGLPTPFYFGDGGVPPIMGWLDLPRLGVTIKPIRQVEIRLDGGYNLYGFNFGASMGVGF